MEPEPEPTPETAPAPTPAPTPAVDPQLLRDLAELRAFKAEHDRAAREAAERKAVASGQAETVKEFYSKELETARAELAAERQRVRRAEAGRALSTALSGKPLVEHGAGLLLRLWSDDFETVDGPNGSYVVRCKTTLRDASEVVAARLASPEYAPFVRAESRGGGGASGGSAAAPTPTQGGAPKNLGEAVAAKWKEQAAAGRNGIGLGGTR